jgi:uncharacterized protein
MEFEWDENKNRKNIEKHKIDFSDASVIFGGEYRRKKSPYPHEERWLATGEVRGKKITVVYTIRGDKYRIISARRAHKNELQEK